MAISQEIKGNLARLLAMEDLIIEHKKVETAQFNVQTRVLTLPQWEKASNVVYDMLVGHEVGHALYTPNKVLPKDIPHSFVNIVEDARIEKLMKRRYPGIAKSFYGGYAELAEKDFFQLEDEEIGEMNLADRVNLQFKIGNHTDIPIESGEETEIVNKIADTETFDDVIAAARELYSYCKKTQDEEIPPEVKANHSDSGESSDNVESEEEEDSVEQQPESRESQEDDTDVSEDTTDSAGSDEPQVRTVENLEENLRDLTSTYGGDTIYSEIPDLNLDTIVVKNSDIHAEIDKFNDLNVEAGGHEVFNDPDSSYREFKRGASKEVNYLIKEFECKKAADSYARSSTSRSGVLDCSKLHTYKYNEDLFKKITTVPDGKNHGLVFVLDWSGSMSTVLSNTLKQLYNLIWFCKKVSIPFDVYAFTNDWNRSHWDPKTKNYIGADLKPHYEKDAGLLSVNDEFNMMNILTSRVQSKQLEKQMMNIWRIAHYYGNNGCLFTIADRMQLSGTPLNEALISLHKILPKFQKDNKVQKVQCIVLTDGEANQLPCHREYSRDGETWIGERYIHHRDGYLRDRKLGTTAKLGFKHYEFTDTILHNLRGNFPTVNFIGIRVLPPREALLFIKCYYEYGNDDYDKVLTQWRKLRSFTIKKSGYHAYFGMASSNLSEDVEFEVRENATKAQIKNAFIKSLKTKKMNKKLLSEFVELVA